MFHLLLLFGQAAIVAHGGQLGLNVLDQIRFLDLVGLADRAEILRNRDTDAEQAHRKRQCQCTCHQKIRVAVPMIC